MPDDMTNDAEALQTIAVAIGGTPEPAEEPATETPAADAATADAATTEVDAKAGEPAKDDADKTKAEPEKPKESGSKLFTTALKMRDEANAKLVQAKEQAAALENERASFDREREAFEAEKTKLANVRKDPLSFFELTGTTPQDLARWLMEDDGSRASRLQREDDDSKRSKVDDETKRELEDLKRWKQEQEEAKAAASLGRAKSYMASFVETNAEKYPDLADEDPAKLAERMWAVAQHHHDATAPKDRNGKIVGPGKYAPVEEIAEFLQNEAADERKRREERKSKRTGQQHSASATSESKTSQRENGQPAKSPGPRSPTTLSNAATTERASAPRELTQEELDEECRRELREALGA